MIQLDPFMNIKNYPIAKKSAKVFFDLGRIFTHSDKKGGIFLNSIPKSGTYLLHQILMNLNFKDKFGFFASTPSWNMQVRSNQEAEKYLSKMYKNEIISGHLFFSKSIENYLLESSLPSVFIYRDPRAIFLSELHYLSNMNRWHRCHKYYARCKSFDEKFDLCLQGLPESDFYYPKFSDRIKDYLGWINSRAVFAIRFEDLINEDTRFREINNLFDYLLPFYECIDNKNFNIEDVKGFILPEKSHTYTGLDPDRWKRNLNSTQLYQLESHLGDLVEEMKYNY
jgi:hypothetical protein